MADAIAKEVPKTTADLGVIHEEIRTRLEQISPDQFVSPTQDPCQHAHVVGTATEAIKRLHTLCNLLAAEHNDLIDKLNAEHRDEDEREIKVQIRRLAVMHHIVDEQLSAEIVYQNDELLLHREVGMGSNWQLFWANHHRASLEEVFGDILSGLVGDPSQD